MSDNQLNNQDDLQKQKPGTEENSIKPKYSPVAAAFIGLIAVFILYQIGGSLLTIAVFGFNLKNADVTSLRLLTTAGQILFILLPALIFAKSIYVNVNKIIRLKLPHVSEIIFFSIGLVLLAVLLQNYLYIQNFIIIKLAETFPFIDKAKSFFDQIDNMVEEAYASLLTYHSVVEASFIIFVVAVVPAICEETFFRGFVQKSFELRYKPFVSALITAVFFGIYHFHPYQIIPLVMLGLYFGFAAYKTNSIFVPMSLHFLNNFIALMLFFVLGKDQISTPMDVSFSDLRVSVISFLGLTVLFSMLILYMNRYYYKVKKSDDHNDDNKNKTGYY